MQKSYCKNHKSLWYSSKCFTSHTQQVEWKCKNDGVVDNTMNERKRETLCAQSQSIVVCVFKQNAIGDCGSHQRCRHLSISTMKCLHFFCYWWRRHRHCFAIVANENPWNDIFCCANQIDDITFIIGSLCSLPTPLHSILWNVNGTNAHDTYFARSIRFANVVIFFSSSFCCLHKHAHTHKNLQSSSTTQRTCQ